MIDLARRRYRDILASVYIYNEHRGYSSLDRVLEAVRARHPDETDFIAAVEKHREDERHHYLMFRHYFEALGAMPYRVDRTCGHIDRLIKLCFGCGIDELDTNAVAGSGTLFAKLCRVIMLTEMRGMRQVDILLSSPLIASDRSLLKIFRVIERDEPSHWMPYHQWIEHHSEPMPSLAERFSDFLVHRTLLLVKLPLLFLNPWLERRADWQDAAERQPSGGGADEQGAGEQGNDQPARAGDVPSGMPGPAIAAAQHTR
ncbi:MAG: hypothetical protein JWN69_1663 [Alphaproteobacteria bacterium]|nr:hypothetical protein [Alphaproteobacteria bacterium]